MSEDSLKNNEKSKPLTDQSEEEEYGASASNDDVTFEYPEIKYEYLDNTADIQVHAWGNCIEEAFEQVGMSGCFD